jgi:hypothetical protein
VSAQFYWQIDIFCTEASGNGKIYEIKEALRRR